MKMSVVLLAVAWASPPLGAADEPTWVEIDGTVYGAKPDETGADRRRRGLRKRVTGGDFTVDGPGVPARRAVRGASPARWSSSRGETEIDLTTRIYIEQLVLEVPAGVTLAGRPRAGRVARAPCSPATR